jgi:glycosyltransferase involved in cell wall biosynthesis
MGVVVRVGLDTSFLDRPPSGIGAYVSALLEWLPQVASDLEIVSLKPDHGPVFTHLGKRGARFFWETVGAGRAASAAKVDLLHMPMMATPVSTLIPTVTTVHDVIPYVIPEYRSTRAQQINIQVARQTLRRARLVIAPSHHAAGDIAEVLGVPRDKVRVTHEAADPMYRPIADEAAICPVLNELNVTEPYIFNVGGLDVRKGIPVLVRAFSELQGEIDPAMRLVIAGARHSNNPTVFPPLDPLIDELGLRDRVVMTGRVTEEQKVALMQGAAIYVTPSLYEGFGLTALEAMACGIPTISSNRTSLPEVVGDGGLLVEPRVREIAAAMREVLTTPELAAQLRERGLRRATAFSWRATAQQTASVYREALERS